MPAANPDNNDVAPTGIPADDNCNKQQAANDDKAQTTIGPSLGPTIYIFS